MKTHNSQKRFHSFLAVLVSRLQCYHVLKNSLTNKNLFFDNEVQHRRVSQKI